MAQPKLRGNVRSTLPGIHLVEIKNIRAVGTVGLPDPRSDYGARIFYGLTGPVSDRFRFRLQYENAKGGEHCKGPFGPILTAIIP